MNVVDYFLKYYRVTERLYSNDNSNNKFVNSYLDQIYVINLEENRVRRKYIEFIMKSLNINFTLIIVKKINKNVYRLLQEEEKKDNEKLTISEMGTYLSHLWCLKKCIQNQYNKFLILEDDIIFHKKFHELFKNVVSHKEYDFLMLGASHFRYNLNTYYVSNGVYRPTFDKLKGNLLGAFACMYSLDCAKHIFNLRRNEITYFDKNFYDIFKKYENTSAICNPNLILADVSNSNLNHNFGIIGYDNLNNYYTDCYNNLDITNYHYIFLDMFHKYKFYNVLFEDRKKAYACMLINYFNNDLRTVQLYANLLDINLFNVDLINDLLIEARKDKTYKVEHKDIMEISEIFGVTPGYMLYSRKNQFRYLCLKFLSNIRNVKIPKIKSNKHKESVLIEYRILPHLEFLIRNTIIKLGKNWSHTVVCGNENYSFIKFICNKISSEIRIINTGHDDMNRQIYSDMMTKESFWKMFKGKKLLIYQEDSCIFYNNIDDFLDWDYIGSPWCKKKELIKYDSSQIGNGGFSLRTKSVMMHICKNYPIENEPITNDVKMYIKTFNFKNIPEDKYFSQVMNREKIGKIADWQSGVNFCVESFGISKSFAGHQFWIYDHSWKNRMYKLNQKYRLLTNKNLSSNTKKSVQDYPILFHKAAVNECKLKSKINYTIIKKSKLSHLYVSHLHCYDITKFDFMYGEYFDKLYKLTDVIVTYSTGVSNSTLLEKNITLLETPNKGMDIGPKFICVDYLKKSKSMYEYILFLHSKSNNEMRKYWFDSLTENLENIIKKNNLNIGGYFPPTIFSGNSKSILWKDKTAFSMENLYKNLYRKYHYNETYMSELIKYFDLNGNDITLFPDGNCYILNKKIITELFGDRKLYNILNFKDSFDFNWVKTVYKLNTNDLFLVYDMYKKYNFCGNNLEFDQKKDFPDGMIEHCFERLLFLLVKKYNLKIEFLNKEKQYSAYYKNITDEVNNIYDKRIIYKNFDWLQYLKENEDVLGKHEKKTKANVWKNYCRSISYDIKK